MVNCCMSNYQARRQFLGRLLRDCSWRSPATHSACGHVLLVQYRRSPLSGSPGILLWQLLWSTCWWREDLGSGSREFQMHFLTQQEVAVMWHPGTNICRRSHKKQLWCTGSTTLVCRDEHIIHRSVWHTCQNPVVNQMYWLTRSLSPVVA